MTAGKVGQFFKMCVGIVEYPVLKILGGSFLALISFLFDGLLKEAMFALFILIIFDFITAIMAVRRTPGEMIESGRLWVTAGKISAYYLLISAGNLAEHGMQEVIPIIDETVLGILSVTELLSIFENAGRMGYVVPKKLIEKLSQYKASK